MPMPGFLGPVFSRFSQSKTQAQVTRPRTTVRSMVAPPNYAKSVEVKNTTSGAVSVKVVFDAHASSEKSDVTHVEEIPGGGTFHFTERVFDAEGGGHQVVAPVKSIEVDGHTLKPEVKGVVGKLSVKAEGTPLKLTQH